MEQAKNQIHYRRKYTKGGRIMGIVGVLLGSVLGILIIMFWMCSPGKVEPYRDANGEILEGSLASKEFVTINNTKMGMIIKSKDTTRPVLLFVHGGVGMPEYFFNEAHPSHLEELFTVVWWDQRGAGLSYDSNISAEEMTTEQMIADINEVSLYLCQRFNQQQIYLMAHSAGSFTAIQAVAKEPRLYKAYIGMGQMTNQTQSEKLAYEYMIQYYTKSGDISKMQKLKAYYGTSKYSRIRDAYMHEAGIGTTRKMQSVITGIVFPEMTVPDYTMTEKINIWRGKLLGGRSKVQQDIWNIDLSKMITKLEVPTYFFSGMYDYTVNYKMAQNYFNEIEAPIKRFYLYENSAHSPIFEESEKALQVLEEDVLGASDDLSI
ncbi:MAG: alpha/beta hydrolase [Cellulosilyticum sp.]|nr:alpha/beta hydrolase [Cellulosilyticum sp.]